MRFEESSHLDKRGAAVHMKARARHELNALFLTSTSQIGNYISDAVYQRIVAAVQ
jgi:hypothetical protein